MAGKTRIASLSCGSLTAILLVSKPALHVYLSQRQHQRTMRTLALLLPLLESAAATCTVTHELGCFADPSGSLLTGYSSLKHGDPHDMRRELCAELCREAKLPVAGVEDGHQCFCGKALPSSAKTSKACTTPCTAKPLEKCGGSYAISVFEYECEGPAPPAPPPAGPYLCPDVSLPYCDPKLSTEERIADILKRMTKHDKMMVLPLLLLELLLLLLLLLILLLLLLLLFLLLLTRPPICIRLLAQRASRGVSAGSTLSCPLSCALCRGGMRRCTAWCASCAYAAASAGGGAIGGAIGGAVGAAAAAAAAAADPSPLQRNGCDQKSGACATQFPEANALGCSFNKTLFYKMADAISTEMRAYYNEGAVGGMTAFAPQLNMAANPLWGRNMECPGEDPFLTSVYAEQYTKGFQGYGHPSGLMKAIVTPKHFTGQVREHSSTEERCGPHVAISPVTLRSSNAEARHGAGLRRRQQQRLGQRHHRQPAG